MDNFHVLVENLRWHIIQIALFLNEAKSKPLKDRSRYYKASCLFSASNIEALVYQLVLDKFNQGAIIEPSKEEKTTHSKVHFLPKEFHHTKDSTKKLVVCIETENKFEWNSEISFNRLIGIGAKLGIFSKTLEKKLHRIREKRNKIHIQGLTHKDHRYSLRDVKSMNAIELALIRKI